MLCLLLKKILFVVVVVGFLLLFCFVLGFFVCFCFFFLSAQTLYEGCASFES